MLFVFFLLFSFSEAQTYCNTTNLFATFDIANVLCTDIFANIAVASTATDTYFFGYNDTNWLLTQTIAKGATNCQITLDFSFFMEEVNKMTIYTLNGTWYKTQEINFFYPISQFDTYYNISTGIAMAVGAPSFNENQGKTYVFSEVNGFFNTVADLTLPGTYLFGSVVSMGNGLLLISSDTYANNGTVHLYAEIFPFGNTSFPNYTRIASRTEAQPFYGSWIDLSSQIAIIGYVDFFDVYFVNNITQIELAQIIPSTITYGSAFMNNFLLGFTSSMYYRFGDTWSNVFNVFSGTITSNYNYALWATCTILASDKLYFYCSSQPDECGFCDTCSNPSTPVISTFSSGNDITITITQTSPDCTALSLILDLPNCVDSGALTVSGCNNLTTLLFPNNASLSKPGCSSYDYINPITICFPVLNCTTTFSVNETFTEMITGTNIFSLEGTNNCVSSLDASFSGCRALIPPNSTVLAFTDSTLADYIEYYIISYTSFSYLIVPYDSCTNVVAVTGCNATYTVETCVSCPLCYSSTNGTIDFGNYINITITLISGGNGTLICDLFIHFANNLTFISDSAIQLSETCFPTLTVYNCTIPVSTTSFVTTGIGSTTALTSHRLTTGGVTTGSISTANPTTNRLTTQRLTTSPITTSKVTTSRLPFTTGLPSSSTIDTTTYHISTTGAVTTGNTVYIAVKPQTIVLIVLPIVGVTIVVIFFAVIQARIHVQAIQRKKSLMTVS